MRRKKALGALATLAAGGALIVPAATTATAASDGPPVGSCSNDVLHVESHWNKKHVWLTVRLRTTCQTKSGPVSWDHDTTRWVF